MKHIMLILVTVFGLSTALAKNIEPIENVGRIIVHLPDVSNLPLSVQEEYKKNDLRMNFRNQEIQPEKEYYVDAGYGCAAISLYSGGTKYIQTEDICIDVKPDQLQHLQFEAVHFEWDFNNLKTDVGPKAGVTFISSKGGENSFLNAIDQNLLDKNLLIGGPGEFGIKFYINGTSQIIDQSKLTVTSTQTFLFSPKDIRENIALDFKNGIPKFSNPELFVVFRSKTYSEPNKTLLPLTYNPNHGNILNYARVIPSQNLQYLKFFPVAKTVDSSSSNAWVLEAITNETRWPLSLAKGLNQVVPVEVINVNNFQTGKPGVFSLARKDTLANSTQKWTPIMSMVNYMYPDLAEIQLPTQTTLLLFPGYEYKFEFFIKDDLGKLFKQDEVLLDLK